MTIATNVTEAPLHIPLAGAHWAASAIEHARRLPEADLTAAVTQAYHALRKHLLKQGAGLHIVRMWNYIPGITDPMPSGGDRYMVFNAGRFAAMCDWFGGPQHLAAKAPAASGVGTDGDALRIIALACPEPGVAVQNPRQTPAVDYSQKFGPRPPCFARATRVGTLLLVSGTAAIRGEESISSEIAGQLEITLENLSLLPAAGLAAYTSLRVFLPSMTDVPLVSQRLSQAFPSTCQIVFEQAALCRRELLVEIEGVASDSSSHVGPI